jgi:hypothetical protein
MSSFPFHPPSSYQFGGIIHANFHPQNALPFHSGIGYFSPHGTKNFSSIPSFPFPFYIFWLSILAFPMRNFIPSLNLLPDFWPHFSSSKIVWLYIYGSLPLYFSSIFGKKQCLKVAIWPNQMGQFNFGIQFWRI